MRYDIKINGNVFGGRQGWAYICNSMRVPVLKADLDKEQEYKENGFCIYDDVQVVWNYRGAERNYIGTLEVNKGEWSIGGSGACLHADFGFSDMMESIENANAPIVREGAIVAVALYSKALKVATLSLFKVGKVNINCMTIAKLIPLTGEEMQEVKADANRWCDR